MWARVVEVMIGCWLALSPFIFRHTVDQQALWYNDFICALAIIVCALFSFWHPLRLAHLANVGIGLWLIGFAYLYSPHPAPPALQNDILTGLLLLLLAIIPNDASQPPQSWKDYYLQRRAASAPAQEKAEATSIRIVSKAWGKRRKLGVW